MSGRLASALVSGAALLALAVRALGASAVFLGDEIFLDVWDGAYHARRALYSFVRFPEILTFDPLLRHPHGAPVPMPPLYDWLLAAVARAFGDDLHTFETVAAWASPTLAALTVLPVYRVGSTVGGRGVGVAAAALFAVLPASVFHSKVGDPDHHAAVALLGACYLALSATLVGSSGRGLATRAAALVLVRTALVLSWSGSLLYLGVGESAFLLGAVLAGRRSLYLLQASGAVATALLLVPWVAALETPLGGSFSSTELSWLQPLAMFAVAAVAAGMFGIERIAPTPRLRARAMRALLLTSGAAALLSGFEPVRDALGVGIGFVGKSDSWAARSVEQVALFRWLGGAPAGGPDWSLRSYGWLAYAIALVPFAFLWRARDPRQRPVAVLLGWWATAFGALAVVQVRFGNEFAPIASVGFALLLDALHRALARPIGPPLARVCSSAIAVGLLWPAFAAAHLPALEALGRRPTESPPAGDPALARSSTALVRFAQLVRETTPETSGFFDADAQPEYAILVRPSLGHVVHYVARRATPIDNFGPYLDAGNEAAVRAFFAATSEGEAVRIAEQLDARYVATFDAQHLRPDTFVHFLHRRDGTAPSGIYSRHFRLVAELPRGAQPHWSHFPAGPPGPVIPYKLYERVAGAALEIESAPGSLVEAELPLVSNTGRPFVYYARARAGSDGLARFRLPYDTEQRGPTKATGPYRIHTGARTIDAFVSRAAVETGASMPRISLGAARPTEAAE